MAAPEETTQLSSSVSDGWGLVRIPGWANQRQRRQRRRGMLREAEEFIRNNFLKVNSSFLPSPSLIPSVLLSFFPSFLPSFLSSSFSFFVPVFISSYSISLLHWLLPYFLCCFLNQRKETSTQRDQEISKFEPITVLLPLWHHFLLLQR